MKLIYATTNPGKFQEVQNFLASYDIKIHTPSEFGVKINVEETGSTLEENAILKAKAFCDALPDNFVVIGDDTGVEIAALGGEPGIRVRRWRGEHMSDQQIIDYCIQRMKNVPVDSRQAQFRTVLAVAKHGQLTQTFDGILSGHIVTKPTPLLIKGFPFESLLYIDEYKMMLGDIHQLSTQEKATKHIFTHRERAFTQSLSYLKKLYQNN